MSEWFSDLKAQFILNFIDDDRWRYLLDGLGVTLEITVFALLIGLTIGITVAIIRATHDNTIETMSPGLGKVILKILNTFSKIYLTVVRGTPVVVQLLIMYYIIFATSNNKIIVAVIAFGVNSGAYVAEIVRSGIMSIDKGQMEAGRSLGLSWMQTMRYVILPQAFKQVIPPLGNEFISMTKETSLVSVIGFEELTRRGQLIIAKTYGSFEIWLTVAAIYLVMTLTIARLVSYLERRFATDDRN